MTIGLLFRLGIDHVLIWIIGNSVNFTNDKVSFQKVTDISGLKLNKEGILREFPDLKGKPDIEMREEAIKRFREKIRSLNTETEKVDYIKEEMVKMGYTLESVKRFGFRDVKIK